MRPLLLVSPLLALSLAGCEGLVGTLGGLGAPDASCDLAAFPGLQLDAVAAEFSDRVQPGLASGCASCHGPGSGRPFVVLASGGDTFHRAFEAGFFKDDPRSLLARLATSDPVSRMPRGGPAWDLDQVAEVARVACQARAWEQQNGTPVDEQFPPNLLEPYAGPPISTYDNTFINAAQLRNKVAAVFQDDWVRDGGSRFDQTLGLLGGVDFQTHFVEARAATPEFLLGLDALAPDVCGRAATLGRGPFAGLDLTSPLVDVPGASTRSFEVETLAVAPSSAVGTPSTNPAGFFCFTNCSFSAPLNVPSPGDYQVTVRARPTLDGNGVGPQLAVTLGGVSASAPLQFATPGAYEERSTTLHLPAAGDTALSVAFINDAVVDGGDRNVYLDSFRVVGPLDAGTGTSRETRARATLAVLSERMLFHPPDAAEATRAYALLTALAALGTPAQAWSGLCEAWVRHPDFLFLLPPSFATTTDAVVRDRLRAVALAQHLVGRPPSATELGLLATGGLGALVDALLVSPDFASWYFGRMRLRLESTGSVASDEPARLWTYLAVNGRPFQELLTATYSVDPDLHQQPRPAEHGATGVLTMKGYLDNKPGLPHYNYPARVLSGFLGSIFEVPPEVFDQRANATASSTVDPQSICFSCHQLLTPLAHQRLAWDDNGDFRTALPDGTPVDDTDRGLVPSYPYRGKGLAAFTSRAVKKEAFTRRMLNAHFKLLMGRDLRHDADERVLYKTLWDLAATSGGDLRAILKAVALSDTFQRKTP